MIPSMWRRLARILSVTLITAGVVILADAAVTLAWQEPLSSLYSSYQQRSADRELAAASDEFLADPAVRDLQGPTRADRRRSVERRASRLADIYAKRLTNGEAIGRITGSTAGVDHVVVQGTDDADLQKGPGHYPDTALPGQGRTIGIAGHRTTYGAPFNDIDSFEKGDRIELEMPYGTFTYSVSDTRIVDPSDVAIVDDTGRELLVLTACHPLYSAAKRYAVFATLDRISLP